MTHLRGAVWEREWESTEWAKRRSPAFTNAELPLMHTPTMQVALRTASVALQAGAKRGDAPEIAAHVAAHGALRREVQRPKLGTAVPHPVRKAAVAQKELARPPQVWTASAEGEGTTRV